MKRYISILLSMILAICIGITSILPAFAEDTTPSEGSGTTQTTEEEPDIPPEEPETGAVRMYLCATANSVTGHVWLYFENNTNKPKEIGYVTLQPGEATSVGSMRNTRSDGGGTYYNGEAYMAKDHIDKVARHTTSIAMDLNNDQLARVNKKIKGSNLYLMVGYNCGDFACSVWNSAARDEGKFVGHFIFPAFTILGILGKGGVKNQLKMQPANDENIYKQYKGGINKADPKSFRVSNIG